MFLEQIVQYAIRTVSMQLSANLAPPHFQSTAFLVYIGLYHHRPGSRSLRGRCLGGDLSDLFVKHIDI